MEKSRSGGNESVLAEDSAAPCGGLTQSSQRAMSYINNESENSCCDSAAWEAQATGGQRSLSGKLSCRDLILKSQLGGLQTALDHQCEGRNDSVKTAERRYRLCLGPGRSTAAAADAGVRLPVKPVVWLGPGTAAPSCASAASSPPPRFHEPPPADRRDGQTAWKHRKLTAFYLCFSVACRSKGTRVTLLYFPKGAMWRKRWRSGRSDSDLFYWASWSWTLTLRKRNFWGAVTQQIKNYNKKVVGVWQRHSFFSSCNFAFYALHPCVSKDEKRVQHARPCCNLYYIYHMLSSF